MVRGHKLLKNHADGSDFSDHDHARYRCHDRPGVLRQQLHPIRQRGPMQHRHSACLDYELEYVQGAEPERGALPNTLPIKMKMADAGYPDDDNKVLDLDLDSIVDLDGAGVDFRW